MPGLYETWEQVINSIPDPAQQKKAYEEYFDIEEDAYRVLLGAANERTLYEGTVAEVGSQLGLSPIHFAVFLDGIGTSLKTPVPYNNLQEDTPVSMDVDIRLLYRNMLDARAKHLYTLPEWDSLLTAEERSEIRSGWLSEKQAVRTVTVGRNDPCPCGSGKKYKKCCWNKDHAAQEA